MAVGARRHRARCRRSVAPLPALIVLSGAGVVLLAIAAPRTMVGPTALAVLFVRPLSTSCSLPR